MFAFGEFNFHLVNVGGIQSFLAQFRALKLRKEILNAANVNRLGIKLTKCKYLDRSFVISKKRSTFIANIHPKNARFLKS